MNTGICILVCDRHLVCDRCRSLARYHQGEPFVRFGERVLRLRRPPRPRHKNTPAPSADEPIAARLQARSQVQAPPFTCSPRSLFVAKQVAHGV